MRFPLQTTPSADFLPRAPIPDLNFSWREVDSTAMSPLQGIAKAKEGTEHET